MPERIGELLSLLLNQKVKVLTVLPNDTTRIADETSLIITDIVVELEDGSIANIEIQKIGYQFPGERCACYSSDLLLDEGTEFPLTVPEGEIFVMGDNRNGSRDSRSTTIGTVKEEYIVGRTLFRFFPFDRFGKIGDTGRLNIVSAEE